MTERRSVLKALGLGGLFGSWWSLGKAANTEAATIPLGRKHEVIPSHWKYNEYLSPKLVGWKGYFYIEESSLDLGGRRVGGQTDSYKGFDMFGSPTYVSSPNYSKMKRVIVAFKTLEDSIVVSPWAIQAPDYFQARKELKSLLQTIYAVGRTFVGDTLTL